MTTADLNRKQSVIFDIVSPETFDPDVINGWTVTVFKKQSIPNTLPVLDVGENREKDGFTAAGKYSWLVDRFSLLFQKIIETAGVPVFEKPLIEQLKYSSRENKLTTSISIARIDHIAPAVYKHAIQATLTSLDFFRNKSPDADNLATYYNYLGSNAIQAIRNLLPPGKSTIQVLKSAHSIGVPFQHLGAGIYQLGWGSRGMRIDRSTCELDSVVGVRLATNKLHTASILYSCGLPVPQHEVAQDVEQAKDIASRLGWPVVVKPVLGERGEGVSVGVNSTRALEQAFNNAKLKKNGSVLVEQEAKGVCHRIFIVKGKLLYAVKRRPKSVQGNGSNTIRELIDQANYKERLSPPWERTEPYPADEVTVRVLAEAGYNFDSIPEQDVWVPLRFIETTQDGGLDDDVTDSICQENIRIAVVASQVMGLNIAGVDIISSDITRPWYSNGAIINEVNFSPLLGGGEISRRHIPEYLHRLVGGSGRIPVTVFTGDNDAFESAMACQQQSVKKGARCYLTSHNRTIDDQGVEIVFPFNTLNERCNALLLNRNVDSIVLVVQNDDIVTTGLLIDRIEKHIVENKNLVFRDKTAKSEHGNKKDGIGKKSADHLISLLNGLVSN